MSYYSPSIEKLIESFEKLPSIGHKTAQRLAFYMLDLSEEEAKEFTDSILNAKKKSSMIITNLVRLALILTYIRGWFMQDHSQDFLIILTFVMTYYPSILEKRFGVYLPNTLQIIITLFIFSLLFE